jgi:hypothetical protein
VRKIGKIFNTTDIAIYFLVCNTSACDMVATASF